jgi:hypothetical protein
MPPDCAVRPDTQASAAAIPFDRSDLSFSNPVLEPFIGKRHHAVMKISILPLAMLALAAGCTTTPEPSQDGIARARLGERVYVDGPAVTPLEVLEDSRCPKGVQCFWEGQLRLKTRVHRGARDELHELTLGQPVQVADGSLELVEAAPEPVTGEPIKPASYRFGFRFIGGL